MEVIQVNSFEEFLQNQDKILKDGYRYINVIGKKMYFSKGANLLVIECLFWRYGG